MKRALYCWILASVFLLFGCKDEVLPKPASQLTLDYPAARYKAFDDGCAFTFLINKAAVIKEKNGCNFTIDYPKMKATIYLSYKPVRGDINLLLRDAQKLTYEHVIKADRIVEQPFVNPNHRVYGMFYQVDGNAATNSQFYVTDSVRHFVDGSVYFYAKPNFDSVMPAVEYLKNDMRKIMETLEWK